MSQVLKTTFKNALAKAGFTVFRTRNAYLQDGLFTIHNDHFRHTPAFRAAYNRGVCASNGVDPAFEWRVHTALWAGVTALRVPGDFVECGVNAGFMSSAIMHHLGFASLDRRFYLIDTFAGPVLEQFSQGEVEQGRLRIATDALAAGAYVTDLARIRANYSEWPNAVVVQGAVPEILDKIEFGPVAFLHLDMNCSFPERAAFEFFWDRLSKGAVILLDDYAYFGHNQQANALDSAARNLGIEILSLPTGQGLIIK